jgi:signal transduction histidine kinase
MSELIGDFMQLSLATRGDFRRQRVDLVAIAAEIVAQLRQSQPERDVEVILDPQLLAEADPHMVRIVLENLIGNAWKFTGRTPHARIQLTTGEDGRGFCVRDNGAGFDEAHAQRLFEPFQRMHSRDEFPGSGVGLATVLRIVRRHGGELSAHGVPGNGARFCFTLEPDR